MDIWQTNATGWYAKDVRDGHGDGGAHWLTGGQRTEGWGVVDFDTVFPGHYAGRCVHTHVAVRPGDRFNSGDGFVHAGQIFFDEGVREVVGVSGRRKEWEWRWCADSDRDMRLIRRIRIGWC